MLYKYRAKKGPEEIVEDIIEASSEKEAVDKLSEMGYLPLKIEEQTSISVTRSSSVSKFLGRVRSREVTIFSRQLASLLKSGMPILTSLNIILEQSENPNLKEMLRNIHNAVKDGATFSASLAQYPKVFSSLYIAMIRAGEDSGTLSQVLFRIADYRQEQEEMLSRFRMALAYPIVMALVGLGTVIFMLTYVMPRLMGIFMNLGQTLPLPTRILISVSKGLRVWWIWVVLATIILFIGRQVKTEKGKISLSLFKLHLPIFGKFILKSELSRFCRTLGLLIKNGIPILKAIDLATPVLGNELIKTQLKQSYKELEQGGSFGRSLKNSKLFPSFVSNLIIVGEQSGKLDDALAEVALSYERDTDEAIRIMASLLEPLMILVMGLIVGFIVIAMLLPIFEINMMVR
jgi:general secretion pathway protein F